MYFVGLLTLGLHSHDLGVFSSRERRTEQLSSVHSAHSATAHLTMATDKQDIWDGSEYFSRPGVVEAGKINARNIVSGVKASGLCELSHLDVLEVGAGVGTVTPHLPFGSIYAIEPSPSMIGVLSEQVKDLKNVQFAVHNLSPDSPAQLAAGEPQLSPTKADPERKLPPPRAVFDVATSTLVAHHVDDFSTFFPGVLGVLKPGGVFVVVEFAHGPNGEDISLREHLAKDDQMVAVTGDDKVLVGKSFRTTWSPHDFNQLLERYGFVDVFTIPGEPVTAFEKGLVPTQITVAKRPA